MISRGELKEVGLVPPLWVRLHPMFQMRREKYSVPTLLAKKLHSKYISYWPNIRKSLHHKTNTSWPWFFIIQQKTHLQSAHLDAIYLCLKAHFFKGKKQNMYTTVKLASGNCYFFWGKKSNYHLLLLCHWVCFTRVPQLTTTLCTLGCPSFCLLIFCWYCLDYKPGLNLNATIIYWYKYNMGKCREVFAISAR